MREKQKNKGITLIALVITIIVLLILAGVTIATLTGDNGILSQAQKAKEETEEAEKEEKNILNSYENYISQVTNGGFVENKGVNSPLLGENMELVSYNEYTGNWDTNNSSSSYEYIAGEEEEDNTKSRWANARVTIDGIDSYFVWIPRYAYKITYKNKQNISEGGTIDVKFLKGISNIAADGTICKYADDKTLNKETDYIIHPAFTSNVDLGGWSEQLTGIWMGKYESSLMDKTSKQNILTNDETSGNILLSDEENKDKVIAVKPGMSSWRYCTIGNMYTNARNYAEGLNSHMMKNSEWGAVAYLTYSKYGRNTNKVEINESENYITADKGIEISCAQSSTGNVYGIYDLVGRANEYVAAYYNKSESENLINGNSFVKFDGKSTKYVTEYNGEVAKNDFILGDATYEVVGWNNTYNAFLNEKFPFLVRGGTTSKKADVFYSSDSHGKADVNTILRLCMIIE